MPDLMWWRRLLCAATFHSWLPWSYVAGRFIERCSYCHTERVR